jgi:alpha-D-xyloside xylohydrolase
MKYDRLRYQLIPYIYSCAHEASTTGMPMARAMVIDYQYEHLAWTHDLQYMWGKEMLVAPNCSDSGSVSVWLPAGTWYDFWNDSTYRGNQVVDYPAPIGKLPLFVRAGSIVPMAPPAPGTAFVPNDTLIVHVYVGADGRFRLYEDDGISEAFRMRGELRTTDIAYTQSEMRVSVGAAAGTYSGAPTQRAYRIVFHALHRPMCIAVQGTKVDFARSESEALTVGIRALWKPQSNLLVVFLGSRPVTQEITVGVVQDCTPSAP